MNGTISQWVDPNKVESFFAYKNDRGQERLTVYTSAGQKITFCNYWATKMAESLEQYQAIKIEFEEHN